MYKMPTFKSFTGVVTGIDNFMTGSENAGCYKLVTVQNMEGNTVNFVVTPYTYFVDQAMVAMGDLVTGFYDADLPVPLIYPPQYRAVVMARAEPARNVKVDFFNSQLISSDGMLKLNIAPYTLVILENEQFFTGNPANRNLVVVYGPTTRSIPAQTTPFEIVVICRESCF
jgi:hypothetical protein